MMELNREQIIKALECFHQRILKTGLAEKVTEADMMAIVDALALIRELTEENERLRKTAEEGTLATTYSARPNIDQKAQIKELLEGGE